MEMKKEKEVRKWGAIEFQQAAKPKNGDRRNHGLHGFSDLRVSATSSVVHPTGEDNSRSKCLVIRVIRAIRGSYFRI